MGKGQAQIRENVVALPHVGARKAFTPEEALAWIAARGKVTMRGTEMAPHWGWSPRRTQKQIQKWLKDDRIVRRGKAISVVSEIQPVANAGAHRAPASRAWVAPAVTAVVLVPVAALNAWPRLVQLWSGESDSGGWSFLAFQLLSLLVMSQIPFAISRQGRNLAAKAVLGGMAVMLVLMNLAFSIESVGHVRDAARDRNRAADQAAASIQRQLDEAREAKSKLPGFVPTNDDEIAAAKRLADQALSSKDQECGKVGDNCRRRVAEFAEAQDKLTRLQADKATGDRAFALDVKISRLETEARQAGPAPVTIDPGAARLSALTLGAASPETVGQWLPILMSFVAELMALLGPYVLSNAIGEGRR